MANFDGVASANWFKNVAKSLGYTSTEVLGDLMPVSVGTIKTTASDIKELRDTLRDSRSSSSSLGKFLDSKTGMIKSNLSDLKSNLKSDLKSGNFNNRQRADEAFNKSMGLDDFNFDLDGDFSFDDDLGDDSFTETISSSEVNVVNANNYGTDPAIASEIIDAVQTQSQILVETSRRSSEENIALAKIQIANDKEIGNILYTGVSAINSNVSLLVDFNRTQTSAFIGASLKYYEDSIRMMNEVVTELKKITTPTNDYNSRESAFDSFLAGDEFSLKSYLEFAKKNAKNNWLLSMVPGIGDDTSLGGFLASVVANPLGELSKIMTKSLIPKMIKTTMEEFDNSIKSFIPNLLTKIYDKGTSSTNPLAEMIGEIFGVKNTVKSKIRTDAYNKGVVPFDGVTRKSIVEVIPTYLSKIYSAISGREEVLFDFENGSFKTKSKIKEDVGRDEKYSAIYQYDSLYDIKKAASKKLGDEEYKNKDFEEKIEKFFVELSKTSQTFNPKKRSDGGDVISKLFTNSDGSIDFSEQELFRQIILQLPKSVQMSIAADQQKAIHNISEFYRRKESSGNDTSILSLFNGTFDDDFSVSGKGSIFAPQDKYGKSSLDYLRNINRILLDRVPVYMVSADPDRESKLKEFTSAKPFSSGSATKRGSGNTKSSSSIEEDEIREEIKKKYHLSGQTITDEELEEEVQKELKRKKAREKFEGSPTDKYGPVYNFIGKVLKKFNLGPFQEKFESGIDKVIGAVSSFTGKIETKMYELIFGKDESDTGEKKPSFFSKIKETITTPFKKAWDSLDEKLFGKDGFFTNIKNSDFYKGLKEKASKAWNWLAGDIDPETGKRTGGLMSDVANEMNDFKDKFTAYFTGRVKRNGKYEIVNENSVFDNVKGIAKSFKDNIRGWLFGDSTDEEIKEKSKGIFTSVGDMFKSGIQTFSNAFFGSTMDADGKETPKVNSEEIIQKIKERAPKTIAGGIVGLGTGALLGAGGFGILGSLFLGPFSGIAIGMGTAFLSQSDKFKDWFFGKTDEETGERVGGVISKSTQNFFKKHKSAIVGGTAFGALKGMLGFGFLPTVLGGPLTGALVGLTSSLVVKSEAFQKLLFGDIDEDTGKRKGGLLGKISTKVGDKDFKKKFGTTLTGALGGLGIGSALSTFGTLGAFAFGPLSGAIAGAASGILLSSDKWKDRIFGTPDEDGKRGNDGLLNKMLDTVTREVLMPAKYKVTEWKFNVKEWFDEKIAEPVLYSLDPIREEFSRLRNRISVFFENIAEKLHIPETISKISDSIKKEFSNIAQQVGEAASKVMGGIGKLIGGVAGAPFKLVEMVASKILLPKHMKEGLASVRKLLIENIKNTFTYKHFIAPIGKAINSVADFTKGVIRGTFDFMKETIKKSFSFAAKTIATIITAPFKVIGGGLSAIFSGIGSIKNLITGKKDGKSDPNIIKNILTGENTFLGSIGSLAATFIPGSKTRRAAQYANISDEDLKERIRESYRQRGEDISDEDLDAEVEKTKKRLPGGAHYQKTREEMRKQREEKRKRDKEQHKEALSRMKEVMENGGSLSDMNRVIDSYAENGLGALEISKLKKDASRLSDKALGNQYGKEFTEKSKIEKDKFKMEMDADKASIDTAENVKTISECIRDISTNGIKLLNPATDNSVPNIYGENEEMKRHAVEHQTIGTTAPEMREENNLIPSSPYSLPILSSGDDSDPNNDAIGGEKRRYMIEHATGGYTAPEARMDIAEKEEKEAKQNLFKKILGKLTDIDETGKIHADQWGEIFGKAGLITLAVTAGIGLIKKLFDWFNSGNFGSSISQVINEFFGTEDENGDRTDPTGDTQTNDDAISAAARGVAWTGGVVKDAVQAAKKAITDSPVGKLIKKLSGKKSAKEAGEEVVEKTVKEAGEEVSEKVTKEATEKVTKETSQEAAQRTTKQLLLGEGSANTADNVANKFIKGNADDAIEVSYEILDEAGNVTGKYNAKTGKLKTDDGIIKKFKEILQSSLNKLKSLITEKFPKIKIGKLSSVFDNLMGIFKGSTIFKYITKISAGIARIASFLVSDVTWGTYGAISGATVSETANLFRVPQDRVDGTMRFISGFFKMILNVSWFFAIDLANDILIALTGIDFINMLATGMYGLLKDDEAELALSDAQAAFKMDYDDYTLTSQIAMGNVEYNEDGSIKYDENGNLVLKDPNRVESLDSYNDRTNQSLAGKIGDKLSGAKDHVKKWFFGNEEDKEKTEELLAQEEALRKAVESGVINEESPAYIEMMEKIQKAKEENTSSKGVVDSLSDFWNNLKTAVKTIFNMNKEGFSSILEGDTVFTDAYWTPPEVSGDETISKISKGLFYGQRVLTILPATVLSIGKYVADGISAVWNGLKFAVTSTFSNMKDGFTDILSGDTVFTSEYWTPSETNDESTSGISKALFYGQRVLTLLPATVLSVGKHVYDFVSEKIVTPLSAILKFQFANAKDGFTDILSGDTVFTEGYWQPPTTNEGESVGLIGNALFYGQRVLTLLPATVLSIGKYAADGISAVWNVLKSVVTTTIDNTLQGVQNIINGDTVFTEGYWQPPESGDGTTSPIGKVLFYGQRVLTLLPATILSIGKYAADGISAVWNVMKSVVTTTINNTSQGVQSIINGDTVFTEGYWTPPESGDGTTSPIGKVLFYGQRVLTLLPATVLSIGKYAADGISAVWNGLKSVVTTTINNTSQGVQSIINGDTVFTEGYWTPPNKSEGIQGTIGKVLFYGQRVLTLLPATVLSIGKYAADGIKAAVGVGKNLKDSITKYADVNEDDLGEKYFTFTGKDDGSLNAKIDKVGFYISRVFMYPIVQIKSVVGKVVDKVTSFVTGIKEWIAEKIEKLGLDNILDGNYTFGDDTVGGGITKGYPRVKGPVSPDNITEGIHSGGIGGSGYEMFKNYGKQTAGYPSYNNSNKPHYGVDRSTKTNSSVPSFTEGRVVETVSKYAPNTGSNTEGHQGGFGNYVKIRDADGGTNIYAHLNKVNVKRGDIVKTGDKIGVEGHTGHSTGTHLHYETWAGANRNSVIDPYLYLKTRKDKKYTGGGITSGYPRRTGYISIDNLLEGRYHGGVGGSDTPGYDLFKSEYAPNQNPSRPFSSDHLGIDYWLQPYKNNAPVKSLTNGTVETALNLYAPNSGYYESNDGSGYGNYVMIRDSNKNRIYYAHMNDVYVKEGDKVKVGDKIGLQGHTGSSTGEHLHLETRKGDVTPRSSAAMDPAKYFTSGGFEQTLTDGTTSGSTSTDTNNVTTTTTSVGMFGGVFDGVITKINEIIDKFQGPVTSIVSKITDFLTPLLGGTIVSESVVNNLVNSSTSSGSSGSTPSAGSIADAGGSENARAIWNYYKSLGIPEPTIAGIMGNLYAESNLNPKNLQQTYERSLGHTDESYTSGVDSGSYKNFVNDSAGYGLAQWTYYSRKQKLLDYAKSKNVSIGDLAMQLDYLLKELQGSYSSTWNKMVSATTPEEASTPMLVEFEKPASLNTTTRAKYAQSYYNQFAGTGGDNSIYTSGLFDEDIYDDGFTYSTNKIDKFATNNNKPIYSTTSAINELKESISNIGANAGGGSEIPERVYNLLDKVVSVLNDISDNTKSTSENVDKLNKKENPEQTSSNTTVVNATNKTNNAMYDVANKRREAKKNQNYSNAQLIASGVH